MDRKLVTILTSFILIGVIVTVAYVFFLIKHVDTLDNYVPAMIFEGVGFSLLAYTLLSRISSAMRVGFSAPIVLITILFIITQSGLNIVLIDQIEQVYFVLMNAILLLLYCMVSFPIYVMGKVKN